MSETGLQCDNPECDWTDVSISFSEYKEWIDKPCPKCGMNLLTQEDYLRSEMLRLSFELINSLPLEEVAKLSAGIVPADLKNHPMFAGAKGLSNLDAKEGTAVITVETHKEVTITETKLKE